MKLLNLIFIFQLTITTLFSQTVIDDPNNRSKNKLNESYYGFEQSGNTANWEATSKTLWSRSNEQVAEGDFSMKFSNQLDSPALLSINTPYTIMKVRTAVKNDSSYIIASTYEGKILAVRYDGSIAWDIDLGGLMNHDLIAEDLDGDGNDEILVASANGNLYCLDSLGNISWTFEGGPTPMYAVCMVKKDNKPYVVCGNFDKNIYYIDPEVATSKKIVGLNDVAKRIESATYSKERVFGKKIVPPSNTHIANFLRRIPQSSGTDLLAVVGTNNMQQSRGGLYIFEAFESMPLSMSGSVRTDLDIKEACGEFKVVDIPKEGTKIIIGNTAISKISGIYLLDPETKEQSVILDGFDNNTDGFGYRITYGEIIPKGDSYQYFVLYGSIVYLVDSDKLGTAAEEIKSRYAYNDLWKDKTNGKLVLASSQSGGSAIHVIDVSKPSWKEEFKNLTPPGKIEAILKNMTTVKDQLSKFTSPNHERAPLPVYYMTELARNKLDANTRSLYDKLDTTYPNSPIFLNSVNRGDKEDWDRSTLFSAEPSNKYIASRDGRINYIACNSTADTASNACYEIRKAKTDGLTESKGISYWGGHGNDPLFYSLETQQAVIDFDESKHKVFIYPELEDDSNDFKFVLDNYIYPLAAYGTDKNTKLFIRTKHTFWQGIVHLPLWADLMSGKYADAFVPGMEETQDKSMELTISGRMGTWMSGAVNAWGHRSVPDNVSFDRMRQIGGQKLNNHFLRHTIYSIANGATYINNLNTNQTDMSLVWELIAKGALYIPKREELLSVSPVHLSIKNPDEDYIERSTNVKWLTFYDKTYDEDNQFVFGRLNGSWLGAQNTPWDFSKYAAGVLDRRQNFLPSYSNGMVLITPPNVADGQPAPQRGRKLFSNMHPMYKQANFTKEFVTNGRDYIVNGSNLNAQSYYKTVKDEIEQKAERLPITVTGDVAWVVAQTGLEKGEKKHLRLTLIDNGYLNPKAGEAVIKFNTVTPVKLTNVLDANENIDISNPSSITIKVPAGSFKFIDVELASDFF